MVVDEADRGPRHLAYLRDEPNDVVEIRLWGSVEDVVTDQSGDPLVLTPAAWCLSAHLRSRHSETGAWVTGSVPNARGFTIRSGGLGSAEERAIFRAEQLQRP